MRVSASFLVTALSLTAVCAQAPAAEVPEVPKFAHLRLGHAAANAGVPPVATIAHFAPVVVPHRAHHCGGMRAKAAHIANMFRKYMGLKPVDIKEVHGHHPHHPHHAHPHAHHHEHPHVHQEHPHHEHPHPHHEHPHHKVETHGVKVAHITIIHVKPWFETAEAYPLRATLRQSQRIHRLEDTPFFVRLQQSLMNLGKWEGRAVSFVLGCGIGALLRMLLVFAIVFVRSIKSKRQQPIELTEEERSLFVVDEYVEEKSASPIVV